MAIDDADCEKTSLSDGDSNEVVFQSKKRNNIGVPTMVAKKDNKETEHYQMWSIAGHAIYPCEKAIDKLEPSQYNVEVDGNGRVYFTKTLVNLDDLMILPDNENERILQSIEHFCTRKTFFKKFGFLWKRGIFLYGPPGGGKTSTIQMVSKTIIDKGGISLYVDNPRLGTKGLDIIRRIEPIRPILVILEDIDAIIDECGEASLLALLDGEHQVDNVIYLSTTNYPEKLDKRFTNRPSRFDEIRYVGMPTRAARKVFFEAKNPRLRKNHTDLNLWLDKTDGYSIAHMKEVIVSVECLGNSFDSTILRLNEMIQNDLSSHKYNKKQSKIGFGLAQAALGG